MKNDHRSKFSNLSNRKEEAWKKKIKASTGYEPVTSALPEVTLVSWFLRNACLNSYLSLNFFWPWISWFPDLFWRKNCRNTRQYICMQRLEDEPVGKFTSKFWPWKNSLKLFFPQKLLFNCLCKRSLPTPFCEFWHVTAPSRQAHVRIRPIVSRIRNPPIRNAHICPCSGSAGY